MREALRRAHLALAPSVTGMDGDQEGIPVFLMEAMATGLPVVSTRHSGIPELVEDGVSGRLVAERDAEALADAMEQLIRQPERWPAMGVAGRKRVLESFEINALNDRLVARFSALLAGGQCVTQPMVSVIVPAFDNLDGLRRCLGPLMAQTWPRDRYEIVVVDNGSTQNVASVVAEFPRVRLVRERQPGSYAARNHGIAVARSEVLAFIDSDCIPIAAWIERGVERLLATPNCGLVAGRIELRFRDAARPTASELYDFLVMGFHQDRHVEAHWGATANLFTTRGVFEKVGVFNASMMSGGDLEWGRRVHAQGYALAYSAEASAAHPARDSLAATLRRAARIAGGRYALKAQAGASVASRAIDLARSVTPAVGFYWRVMGDPRLPKVSDRARVVLVALAVKYAEAGELIRLTLGGSPRRE